MPPKSASARSAPRQSTSTAGKSVGRSGRKSNYASSLVDTAAAAASPSSTAVRKVPDIARKIGDIVSPITNSGRCKSPVTAPLSHTQRDNSGNEYLVTFGEAANTGSLEAETVVGGENGNTCEKILSPGPVAGLFGKGERADNPPAEAESGTKGIMGAQKGKKKIVKRTVRVVRKVIKRVQKNASNSMNKENVSHSNEVPGNLNLGNDVNEDSNLTSGAVAEKLNIADVAMEKSNAGVLEPMLRRRGVDLTGKDSFKVPTLDCNDKKTGVNRRYYVNDIDSMEVEKVSSTPEITHKSERLKGGDDLAIKCAGESFMESDLSKGLGGFRKGTLNEDSLVDNSKTENMEQVRDQKVDHVEDTCDDFLGTPVRTGSGDAHLQDKFNPEVEGNTAQFNDGLLRSGELEALERKKRRKTEIFVGGLSKDTKEDDIRDAFKVAGEIVQVRLAINTKTGKNKGFSFIRFATASDAKNALEKCSRVAICGIQCDAVAVEGNDTLFLGNVDRTWKSEDVVKFLEKAGIEKIDVITIKSDPNNMENNRGFAFVEFETIKDAQIAFNKLKKKNILGNIMSIQIAWAKPLIEPSEEQILKVKSVYAEFLPPTWDEEKVKEFFGKFGEIENVVLAKDLVSSKRKDFAFINYSTRDAALACIEAVSRDKTENGCSKMIVSLANPTPRTKERKPASLSSNQVFLEKPKKMLATMKLHEQVKKEKLVGGIYDDAKVGGSRSSISFYEDAKVGCGRFSASIFADEKAGSSSSTTDELVQILRQQALSSKHAPPRHITGTSVVDHNFHFTGSKRLFSHVEADQLYLESRALSRARIGSSYSISGPSVLSHGIGGTSFPYNHYQELGHTSESFTGRRTHSSLSQTTKAAPYQWNSNQYHRYC